MHLPRTKERRSPLQVVQSQVAATLGPYVQAGTRFWKVSLADASAATGQFWRNPFGFIGEGGQVFKSYQILRSYVISAGWTDRPRQNADLAHAHAAAMHVEV